MPLRQYMLLKKAVEIESLIQRKIRIQDINHAFNNPKSLLKQLEQDLEKLIGSDAKKNTISWGKDSNWKSKLMGSPLGKYMKKE